MRYRLVTVCLALAAMISSSSTAPHLQQEDAKIGELTKLQGSAKSVMTRQEQQIVQSEQPKKPAKVQPEPLLDVQPQPMVDVQPDPMLDVQPEPLVDVQPEPLVDVQPEPLLDVQPEPLVDVQPEPLLDVQLEPLLDVQPEPMVAVKQDPLGTGKQKLLNINQVLETSQVSSAAYQSSGSVDRVFVMEQADCDGVRIENSCYTFHGRRESDKKTWEQAQEDCFDRQGYLVEIETMEEWNALERYRYRLSLRSDTTLSGINTGGKVVWVGARLRTEINNTHKTWFWESGLSMDSSILARIRVDARAGEECLGMLPHEFYSRPCSTSYKRPYICEYP